jgi:hypothetical protein
MAGLLRQSIYSRLAGCEDVNDAERCSQDLTLRRGARNTSRAGVSDEGGPLLAEQIRAIVNYYPGGHHSHG